MEDLKLSTPLKIEEIDFRIQSINKGGYATILAYKDARVDMNRLDAVVGDKFWQDKYELINGNLFCSIGIYNIELQQWIWKQNVGTESNTEKEKGQASDAFKRAGFCWGIGRELYDYPVIQVKLNKDEFTLKDGKAYATWELKLKEWKWYSSFDGKEIISLSAYDQNGQVRYNYTKIPSSEPKTKTPTPQDSRPELTEKLLNKALERIDKGEEGVFDNVDKAFRMSKDFRNTLMAATAKL